MSNNILIAAGGTGGHINAAIALGEELAKNNSKVIYCSGERELDYKLFRNFNCKHMKARPLVGKSLKIMIASIFFNTMVFFKAFGLIRNNNINKIIGCGGYICGPVLLAGFCLRKKIYIIEQNSVMGLTNKILAKIADIIFINYKNTIGLNHNLFLEKIIVSGNPIRFNLKNLNTQKKSFEQINVLVFGGSLGASELINSLLIMAKKELHKNLNFLVQTGLSNQDKIKEFSGFNNFTITSYIENMDEKYNWADIIIARSGASTVSELEIVGKPSILIPYKHSDKHQFYNAKNLKEENQFRVSVISEHKNDENLASLIEQELNQIILNQDYKNIFPKENKAVQVILEAINK